MYSQIIINTLVSASAYVLVGVSFYLTFLVARFYHFTHGGFFALGAYVAYSTVAHTGLSVVLAAPVGMIVSGLLAMGMERLVFRRVQAAAGGSLVALLASLGLYTVTQNCISLYYGDSANSLPGARAWGVIDVFGGRLTIAQTWQFVLAACVVLVVGQIVLRSDLGRQMRAIGEDRDRALAVGIPVGRIVGYAFGLGYALAALAGIIAAADVDLTPTMGMRPMMMGMVAMIIGGVSLHGTVGGAVLLAVAQQLGILWLPSQWQDAIAFGVLLGVLVWRPAGIFRTGSASP